MGHINVDTDFLAKCLGLEKWPNWSYPGAKPGEPAYLVNSHQRMAARVITDALRPDEFGRVCADIAINKATKWIDTAYDNGLRAGIDLERRRWERKIAEMFGMKMKL